MAERSELCETCRYWNRYHSTSLKGECRRNPPSVLHDHNDIWPETDIEDWCGEHKAHGHDSAGN